MNSKKINSLIYLSFVILAIVILLLGLGIVIYNTLKCPYTVSEVTCHIKNYKIISDYIKDNALYMVIEITFCYNDVCITEEKDSDYTLYNKTDNIICWYVNDDLNTMGINDIKTYCDKRTKNADVGTKLIIFWLMIFIIAFANITETYCRKCRNAYYDLFDTDKQDK